MLLALSVLSALLVSEPHTLRAPHKHLKASVDEDPHTLCAPHRHLLPDTVELLSEKTDEPQTDRAPHKHLSAATDELEFVESNCQIADTEAIGLVHGAEPASTPGVLPDPQSAR